MWRSKKFIIIALLAVVLVVGSIGGIALAQAEENGGSQQGTIFDRVAAILTDEGVDITAEQLKDAFKQAANQAQIEALQKRLENMVSEGRITQEEADDYLQWWQDRPNVPFGFGFKDGHRFPGMFRGMHRGFSGGSTATVQ